MPTSSKFAANIEDQVIEYLKKSAITLMIAMNHDLPEIDEGIPEAIVSANHNFRMLNALNEILLYFGDEGVFMIDPEDKRG